ncbi:MAG: DUF885 domain-containing protein [Maricaulaceae bacterium]
MASCTQGSETSANQSDFITLESDAVNRWFDDRYNDELARSPISQTRLGLRKSLSRLDDVSQQALDENSALLLGWRQDLTTTFDVDRLNEQTRLSYDLFLYDTDNRLAQHEFADQNYIFQHMSGPHTSLPAFLINNHPVTSIAEAEAYIARLVAVQDYLGQYTQRAETQADKGVLLPRYIYPKLIEAAQNVITGAPFNGVNESPLLKSFTEKVDKLDTDSEVKNRLKLNASSALLNHTGPAYQNLITMFHLHHSISDDQDGVWKLPQGEAFYQSRLKHYTTTDMSADEIHQIGLKEVARIQAEMRLIMEQIGFTGSLQDFFDELRTDPKFTYDNDDEGRSRYIQEATAYIDDMRDQLDTLFITKPRADMVVKRVEPFREATAFGAFYNRPALDGSRPGTYYINLKDMNDLPTYQIQALAYHEGIPGHHMQLALSMELQGLPKFRTLGGHTAYIEGWALYSESVPGELGLYTDPYQDFGRLSMEIFRAVRLVVDTGIHSKKWTREQAVAYFLVNSANAEGDIRAEVDRYIVWPGQATAYKIGMIKIQELRQLAETELGDEFDIAAFHDVILANGSVPLSVLETLVTNWIKKEKG